MATTVLNGALGVEDVLAGKAVRDVTPGLQRKYPDISPLFMIFNAIPKGRTAMNPKVEWTLKEDLPREHYLTTDVAQGATATLIPAQTAGGSADTTPFKTGDVIWYPNGTMSATVTNIGVVTTVNAGVSIVVTPVGWQSNLEASAKVLFSATTTGDRIMILHDASEEYSQKPTAKVTKDSQEWNYVTFLRAPYIVGNILKDQKNYTGPERSERRDETYRDIRIQAENAVMWGDRYYRAGTNGRQYFCRGLHEYIRQGAGSNILTNWSAGLTASQLDEYLVKGPGMYGSDNKLWFMSNDLFLKVTEIGKEGKRIDMTRSVRKFGLAFLEYLAPDGKTYYLRRHHLFNGEMAGYGMIVDPAFAKLRPYGTQGTMRLMTEIQENDRAGIADEWQVIFSLEVSRIEPHGYQTA